MPRRTKSATDPVVILPQSKVSYRGVLRSSVEEFHNIRFAHDTSGSGRFAPPRPYSPPHGTEVDATVPGPACPQTRAAIPPFFGETPNQSEDCLNLRITRPAGIEASKLPVVVHITGGGVIKGSADESNYDPTNLVEHSASIGKPIIHVVLNWRLTIYGFARLPNLKDQGSLNVGMRDQRAGFQWVKDNIEAFGGDPTRITAFGLSSGGTLSSLHLMTYGGKHGVPFTQAWVMSGPPGTALNITSDATELHTYAVAELLGCRDEGANDEAVLACLREVPMDTLTETAMAYSVANHPPAGLFTFIPSVDDDFLLDRQSSLYEAGNFVKGVPMVFGWAQDDGATNAGPAPMFQSQEDMETPIRNFAHALSDDDYKKLFAQYPEQAFEEDVQRYEARKAESDPNVPVHYFRIARIMRDLLFTCSSIDFGYEMARQSQEKEGFAGVYHYALNQSMVAPLFRAAGMPWLGTVHGSDLDYLYNNIFPRGHLSEEDRELSDTMISYFVNFAYTGRPGGEGHPPWPESFQGWDGLRAGSPDTFNLQVMGGPLGTGAVRLTKRSSQSVTEGQYKDTLGSMQIPLGDDHIKYDEMGSLVDQQRQRELQREDIFERCSFIKSLAKKLDH
ncbi:alpha/beta-hydrolase [Nemania abortiva]|nr:alpha/beta-hydrolase [Nemania abortiva]